MGVRFAFPECGEANRLLRIYAGARLLAKQEEQSDEEREECHKECVCGRGRLETTTPQNRRKLRSEISERLLYRTAKNARKRSQFRVKRAKSSEVRRNCTSLVLVLAALWDSIFESRGFFLALFEFGGGHTPLHLSCYTTLVENN